MSVLCSVLARPASGSFSNTTEFRKYYSALTTQVKLGGNIDVSTKKIGYEVGVRHKTMAVALKNHGEDTVPITTAYDTSEVSSAAFMGLAKKFSNFSATFSRANLAGVAERIAKGLACDSAYREGCSASTLADGRLVRVHALSTYAGPIAANQETVFIPRLVDSLIAPDVFSTLCFAIAGEGGVVATDMLELDANTREPKIHDVTDYAFAPAAVDALRIIGANMGAAGAGDLFGLAVTRGIHSVLTVVGHSDEGGFIRDVLRTGSFGVPFGGIHYDVGSYAGLPALATSSSETVAGYVDSLALATAGLVAHCDPGVFYNGVWFPTVVCGMGGLSPEVPAGEHQEPNDSLGSSNLAGVVRTGGAFAQKYCPALAKLFGFADSCGNAATHLAACFSMVDPNSRHLKFASVSPYFWVEPTSLIPHDFTGYEAESEGFAALATKHSARDVPCWEDVQSHGPPDSCVSNYMVRFRGARAAPFLAHFNGHRDNGLGHVVIRQMDPAGVIHPGPHDRTLVSDRILSRTPMSGYLWRRGQSPLPAPSEFLNLGETLAIRVHHLSFDDDGNPEPHHVPSVSEFANMTVKIFVGAPTGGRRGKLTEHGFEARRGRTLAARALDRAAARTQAYGSPIIGDIPILLSAPPTLRGRVAAVDVGPDPTQVRKSAALTIAAEGAHDPNEGGHTSKVVPVSATQLSGPVRGPAVPPGAAQHSASRGGGVNASDASIASAARASAAVIEEDPNTVGLPETHAPMTSSSGAAPTERAEQQ